MIKNTLIKICLAIVVFVQLVSTSAYANGDVQAPSITHQPTNTAIGYKNDFPISATVVDNVKVAEVLLFYRTIGDKEYSQIEMKPTHEKDVYLAEVPSWKLEKPGIEYFIQAEDNAGNSVLYGFSFSPVAIQVSEHAPSAVAKTDSNPFSDKKNSAKKSSKKWIWIAIGAAVVAGAAAAGGGSGGGPETPSTTDIDVVAPIPQ